MRKFNKQKSVFRDWNEEPDIIKKQFEYDCQFMKVARFIKDKRDLKDVYTVLLNNYKDVRNHFTFQIA